VDASSPEEDVALPVAVTVVAARQRGLITREQCLANGLTRSSLQRRLGRDLLVVHPGVYRIPGAPVTWEQRALAAVLAVSPYGALSHRSAAVAWNLLSIDAPIEVVVPRGNHPDLDGVIVHRSVDLAREHMTMRDGTWMTNPLRTMVDLGAVVPWWLVREALDSGVANKLFTVTAVAAERSRLAACGRDGCGVLAVALERSLLTDRMRSKLEARFARLCRRHGLPTAAFQHRVYEDDRFLGQVDFAYPELKIAIEVDGMETHGSPTAVEADYARQNRLVAAGWIVIRFTWFQVSRRQAEVASIVRRTLDRVGPGFRV
jgi:very-short-patch-repair endonuclease